MAAMAASTVSADTSLIMCTGSVRGPYHDGEWKWAAGVIGECGSHLDDANRLRLPYAVHAIFCLPVILRIEIAVEENHGVRTHKVDAEPSRARAEQQREGGLAPVVRVDDLLPLRGGRGTIESHELVALLAHKPLEDREDLHEESQL